MMTAANSNQPVDPARLLEQLADGLNDMRRRGLLGEDHCPDDNQWIDAMLERVNEWRSVDAP